MIKRAFLDRVARVQLAESKISYAHFILLDKWIKQPFTYATVAISTLDGVTYFGISYCSPKDQFSRKTGRVMSLRKLFTDPKELHILLEDRRPHTLAHYALNESIHQDQLPTKWGISSVLPIGYRRYKKVD